MATQTQLVELEFSALNLETQISEVSDFVIQSGNEQHEKLARVLSIIKPILQLIVKIPFVPKKIKEAIKQLLPLIDLF